MNHVRLDKLVADRSTLSRSQARASIRRGRVRVDGAVITDPGAGVDPRAAIALNEAPLAAPPRLALAHKPAGVQCTVGDPLGRPSLSELWPDALALGLHPVGRLDADTDGLLLLSADGALTQRLLHPRHAVVKVYEATVENEVGPDLGARLAAGVETADGVHPAELREVRGDVLTIAVSEGKHRMVRRVLANSGHPVLALRRVAFGGLHLGQLAPGAWRPATAEELAWADALVGGGGG
jgi:pseudouridine synthase